jgi:hypothetical protein
MTDGVEFDAEGSDAEGFDAVLRPRLIARYAYGIAAVIATVGIVAGIFLKAKSTGAYFRTADQVAVASIGLLIAGAVLLLVRPRLRIGPAGLAVRNLLGDRLIPWEDVVEVWFPPGARWARVELPDYEYVAVLAIQSFDGERAVDAMDTVRELTAKYRPARRA